MYVTRDLLIVIRIRRKERKSNAKMGKERKCTPLIHIRQSIRLCTYIETFIVRKVDEIIMKLLYTINRVDSTTNTRHSFENSLTKIKGEKKEQKKIGKKEKQKKNTSAVYDIAR